MRIKNFILIIIAFIGLTLSATANSDNVLNFLNLRFGMFIHFNMGTFHGEQWAKPNHNPMSFAPDKLDCNQWALAAKSAKMRYAVLTTKHHDGFCLWDSNVTKYDVGSSAFKGDVVRQYVDAFRKAGLKVGLYFSIWDRTEDISHGHITPEKIEFIKAQLTELLTNYGDIECIVTDGWGSRWGNGPDFDELPFATIAEHVKKLQPNCLLINHSCRADLAYTDIVHYEATHGQHIPYDNTYPSQQGPTLQPSWFWMKGFDNEPLKSVDSVLEELAFANKMYSNYLLNAAPNSSGLMDENVVRRLAEIGDNVVFPKPLKKLPALHRPNDAVKVSASSVADGHSARNSIDSNLFTSWMASKGDKTPIVEFDFGKPEVLNFLTIHGGYKKSIKQYAVEALVDGAWKTLHIGNDMTFHEKIRFDSTKAQKYRIRVIESRGVPEIVEVTFVRY